MTHDLLHREVVAAAVFTTLCLALLLGGAFVDRFGDVAPLRARPIAVDLNRASLDALTVLPGVGHKTALAILCGRPYRTLDDLADVVGPKRARGLAPYVTLR